jgi:hypothetical protein
MFLLAPSKQLDIDAALPWLMNRTWRRDEIAHITVSGDFSATFETVGSLEPDVERP